jgi:hypothetical protein
MPMAVRMVEGGQPAAVHGLVAVALSALVAIVIGGCDSSRISGPARTVSLSDFAATESHASPEVQGDQAVPSAVQLPGAVLHPGVRLPGVRDAPRAAGAPAGPEARLGELGAVESGPPARAGDRLLVDSLVGQVSGRPIYADDFLAPIEDRLTQMRRSSPATFVREAEALIRDTLRGVVFNELFLADAESELTPEQQMGLFAFLRERQREIIRESGGYREGAEAFLREREQRSLSEQVETERQSLLINDMLRRRVWPRAIVSWRDVQREFERQRDRINPRPQMLVQRLVLDPATQGPLVQSFTAALAAGVPFDRIITDQPELTEAVSDLPALELDDSGAPRLDNEAYRAVLTGLAAGAVGGPIESRGQQVWLHVRDISRPPVQTIYDPEVQLGLLNTLHARRREEAQARYAQRLLDKGVYDDIDRMLMRLYDVALARYGR